MNILLNNIIPFPIPEKDIEKSEIWNKTIEINRSDKLMIYADSGKGKTTLLNIIYGIRNDYAGEILIDNKNIRDFSNNDISKLRKTQISFVPQGLFLFPELSALENIKIKNKISNFKTDIEIAQLFETLNIQDVMNKKTGILSYGQQQRVAIIRALCQPFEFIFLDEIFSHIDQNNAEIAWNLITTEVEKQNAGIIFTSLGKEMSFGKLESIKI